MQKKKKLPSGHELVINSVPYAAAKRLRRLVAAEMVKVDAKFSEGLIPALLVKEIDPKTGAVDEDKRKGNVLAALSGTDLNTVKNFLFQLLASEEIEDAVLDCMEKWMLDGIAVKAETFHPDDRRGDLIPCAVEVGRYALLPFFESLGFSSSSQSNQAESAAQK